MIITAVFTLIIMCFYLDQINTRLKDIQYNMAWLTYKLDKKDDL